uniref:cache domain-containing protein n=1 Tax=Stappia sp. TaxID=1870903 RepID=UPI003BAD055E
MRPSLLPLAAVLMLVACVGPGLANGFSEDLRALATGRIAEIVSLPQVVEAVRAQNMETAAFGQERIDELDRMWRAEAESAEQPMIDAVMERPLSLYLAEVQDASRGLFTEIFVTDARGLNVGQSRVTSDYWQGDEAMWQDTVLGGPGAINIGALVEDDSTLTVQSQVSVPVIDPESGQVIGAATFGVNVERL